MKLLSLLFILLGASTLAHAQPAAVHLTLPEAIARGLEGSNRIGELDARADAAHAVEHQRAAAAQPQVSLIASYTRTNHVDEFAVPNPTGGIRIIYPDVPDNVRTRVDLQWPIYTAGRLQALTRAAGADAQAAGYDRDAARADQKLEITRGYWAVVTANASLRVVTQALERTNAHLVDVRHQLSVGLVPPSDVLTIEAQHARQRMLLIEAENILEGASADFRRLVGLEPETPFELVDALPTTDPRYRAGLAKPATVPDPAYGSLAEAANTLTQPFSVVLNTARAGRPERKGLEFRIKAATERTAAASAGRLPVLAAIGGYDFARPNPRIFPIQKAWKPSWDLGINVRWALFDSGRTRAETAEAIANRRAAEARLREFDSVIAAEIAQRKADVRSAQASITAAHAGISAASEARRVLADRFQAGVATNTDVLNAQVALLQAELDMTRAIANAQLAAARLDRAMGR